MLFGFMCCCVLLVSCDKSDKWVVEARTSCYARQRHGSAHQGKGCGAELLLGGTGQKNNTIQLTFDLHNFTRTLGFVSNYEVPPFLRLDSENVSATLQLYCLKLAGVAQTRFSALLRITAEWTSFYSKKNYNKEILKHHGYPGNVSDEKVYKQFQNFSVSQVQCARGSAINVPVTQIVQIWLREKPFLPLLFTIQRAEYDDTLAPGIAFVGERQRKGPHLVIDLTARGKCKACLVTTTVSRHQKYTKIIKMK